MVANCWRWSRRDPFTCDTVAVVSNDVAHRRPIFRLALFLVCAILIFLALNTLYAFTSTLNRLDAVESERDQWQRPSDVLRALDLGPGNTAVDLGSGAGYFTLKLAPTVGKQGQVLAVDLRKLSLFFLWTRALLRGQRNIHVIVGEEDDPRLLRKRSQVLILGGLLHRRSSRYE